MSKRYRMPNWAVGGLWLVLGILALSLGLYFAASAGDVEAKVTLSYITSVLPRVAGIPLGLGLSCFGVYVLGGDGMPRWISKLGGYMLLVALGAVALNIVLALVGLICALV